jgi:hypothetical protein
MKQQRVLGIEDNSDTLYTASVKLWSESVDISSLVFSHYIFKSMLLLNFVSEMINNIFLVHPNHHLLTCILVHSKGYGLQTELPVI